MDRFRTMLIIMDGWGWREAEEGNAVRLARTPHVDALMAHYPSTLIQASGPWVGLPEGQMGNSEVGHLNLGAGRVVYQDIMRIHRAVEDGSFFENPVLVRAMETARGHTLHLMGLVSDGGVHSHIDHLVALLRMAHELGVERVAVHAILDGRDTSPHGGAGYLRTLGERMAAIGTGRVASVVGRYYAMDRDRRWERTRRAWALYALGEGERATDPVAAVEASYARDVTDEFVEPVCIVDDAGTPRATVRDDDVVVFFNFRADRARQITRAFTEASFDGFERPVTPRVHWVCMTRYDETFDLPVVFPPESMRNILAEVTAAAGRRSLRIAETEKYAHVTYFFNGGDETAWPGETRILVPSPKVATYDLQPEMSAREVTERLLAELASDRHDWIVCNFANPDMVGHTGVLEAAIRACETVDACVGRVIEALDLGRWRAIVTADHGNADVMIDPDTGAPHTAHTTSPVPCILVDPDYRGELVDDGSLRDIAPTMLNWMGIDPPPQMTGRDLRRDR